MLVYDCEWDINDTSGCGGGLSTHVKVVTEHFRDPRQSGIALGSETGGHIAGRCLDIHAHGDVRRSIVEHRGGQL